MQAPQAAQKSPISKIIPFEIIDGGNAPLLLICEHATASIPSDLDNLGVAPADLQRHIALDIGAAAVTRGLAVRLQAPTVIATVSRLVVDCNRPADHPDAIPEVSDETLIPGNVGLSPEQKTERIADFHTPFHAAIADTLAALRQRHRDPALVSIHSFTPSLRGQPLRPWHVGILWGEDDRLAAPLIAALEGEPGLVVGDNEPYPGRTLFYTLDTHAAAAGLPHLCVEIRQDLIADDAGVAEWVERLGRLLPGCLGAV